MASAAGEVEAALQRCHRQYAPALKWPWAISVHEMSLTASPDVLVSLQAGGLQHMPW